MKGNSLTGFIVGLVFFIFMGITAISMGFGALYPPLNLIAKPLVCPNGEMGYVRSVYNPLPGTTYIQAGWHCTDPASGDQTRLSNVPINLFAGVIYGVLLFLLVKLIVLIRRR